MLLMLAWACRLMLLMLVVSWPRCACVSGILALGVMLELSSQPVALK